MIRSRPPPPGSAAHTPTGGRASVLLNGEAEHQEPVPERASPHILTRFLQPKPVGLLKDLAGESLRGGGRKEKKAGECEARWCNHPPSLSHLSPFQSALSNILRDLKTNQESRLLSAVGGSLHRVPELLEVQQPQLSGLCCVRDTSGSSKGRSARTGNYLSLSHQRAAWWEFLPLFSVSGFL